MNLVEKVAVALARSRFRRNMDRDPPLTPEEILHAVSVEPESRAALMADARAAIEAVESERERTVTHTLDFQSRAVRTEVCDPADVELGGEG